MYVDIWLGKGASFIKQFADQVRVRLISQLINCNSIVFQKLLKY